MTVKALTAFRKKTTVGQYCDHGKDPQKQPESIKDPRPLFVPDAYIALKQADVSVRLRDVEQVYINNRNRIAISDDLVELVKKREGPG